MPDATIDDQFEMVAIVWNQPEAAVMLSMFEFYGIPAFAVGQLHASVMPAWIVGLQGIQIRVPVDAIDDALELLAEVAERPAAVRPVMVEPALYLVLLFAAVLVSGLAPPIYAPIGWAWLVLIMAAIPTSRTASTFMLWKRSAAPA